jgi:enolase-phosphatase E1
VVRAVLTDIEGTTSALSFVKDVLFPYARERLPAFIRERGNDPAVRPLLEESRLIAGQALDEEALLRQLIAWIDEDRKITPLKALQGLIWEAGYRRGNFTGHVYADAARCLCKWHQKGLILAVYSSGSVHAQKLLFAHTEYGDLTPLFSCFFDTTVGHKREPESYQAIATAMALPAGEILFLSDVREELDAARQAGMQTGWLLRDEEPDPAAGHPQYRNFEAIPV